jgi:hypothetical protein
MNGGATPPSLRTLRESDAARERAQTASPDGRPGVARIPKQLAGLAGA